MREGQFQWTVPDGQWQLLTVWQKPMRYVKRAAPGGAGWMLNTFDRKAIDTYLERFTEAFDAYDGPLPRAQYHDSYEYQCNWSPNLFGEFERRRGYPLQDRLPELFELAGTDETQNRVRADYQRTLNDLMLSDFLKPWTEWSRHRGMVTRNQAHGSPGNLLDLYAVADIPEAEMFRQDRDPLVAKFASSAAHVAGRQLVSSETGTWLRDHYHVTLGDLKRLVDDFFTSGINHIIYHGNCYSPAEAPWPGWTFYAATQMNPRNTIWHDVPTLNAYITRCQSILQAGRPDNDVLVYWPIEDLWHATGELAPQLTVHHTEWLTRQPIGKTARRLWDRGYAFDYISDRLLEKASSDESGRIVTPGAQYRVLVVPPCQHMPLATLKKLLVLAEQGATIIFEDKLPTDVPGLAKLDMRRVKLEAMLAPLAPTEWSDGKSPRSIAVGQGTVWIGDLEPALEAAGTPREAMADLGIEFIRRSTETGKDYFVVNLGKEPIDTWVPLAVEAKSVVVMDPMTGKVGLGAVRGQRPEVGDHGEGSGFGVQGSGFEVAASQRDARRSAATTSHLPPATNHQTQIYLQLAPGESRILRTYDKAPKGTPRWKYITLSGKPAELTGQWQIEFLEGGPKLPEPIATDGLKSWTELGDEAKHFSGTARYSLTFDTPASVPLAPPVPTKADISNGKSAGCRLDLGDCRQSARITLNGTHIGTLIASPFRLDLPADLLRPGGNVLEVEVTNLAANRIADLDRRKIPWKYFHDANVVNINYRPLDASRWLPEPSGLLGPVTIVPLRETEP